MKHSVTLHKKHITVEITARADKVLKQREQPLIADVHLIFGCMITKRVWFKEQVNESWVAVTDKLGLSFQAVTYDVCSFENIDNGGTPKPFPLGRELNKFIPHQVSIDYKNNKFVGEFTFNKEQNLIDEKNFNLLANQL